MNIVGKEEELDTVDGSMTMGSRDSSILPETDYNFGTTDSVINKLGSVEIREVHKQNIEPYKDAFEAMPIDRKRAERENKEITKKQATDYMNKYGFNDNRSCLYSRQRKFVFLFILFLLFLLLFVIIFVITNNNNEENDENNIENKPTISPTISPTLKPTISPTLSPTLSLASKLNLTNDDLGSLLCRLKLDFNNENQPNFMFCRDNDDFFTCDENNNGNFTRGSCNQLSGSEPLVCCENEVLLLGANNNDLCVEQNDTCVADEIIDILVQNSDELLEDEEDFINFLIDCEVGVEDTICLTTNELVKCTDGVINVDSAIDCLSLNET